jgi:hypothetical protein
VEWWCPRGVPSVEVPRLRLQTHSRGAIPLRGPPPCP